MHTLPAWNPTPPVLEAEVQTKITQLLEAVGFRVWWIEQGNAARMKRSRGKRTEGVPDIYAVHPSRAIIVWIEVKGIKTGHGASKEQIKFAAATVAAGGQCIIGSNNTDSLGGYTEVVSALEAWGILT